MAEFEADECRERIKELNAQIAKLAARPASTSAKGISVSFQGKLSDLRKERKFWQHELAKALADEGTASGAQGPKLKLQ